MAVSVGAFFFERPPQPTAEPNFDKLPPPEQFPMGSSGEMVNVYDARILQSMFNGTKAEFFRKHGFVLLPVPEGQPSPHEVSATSLGLIPILFPGKKVVKYTPHLPTCTVRGPDGEGYSLASNHQDFGLNVSSFAHTNSWVLDWVAHPEAKQITRINMWKPFNMPGPLTYAPLCVADYRYNSMVDVSGLASLPQQGEWQAQIKGEPTQKWYYYPKMTNDEVLVFKTWEWHRGDETKKPYMRTAFHGALPIYSGPKRQSIDCRANLMLNWKDTPQELSSSM